MYFVRKRLLSLARKVGEAEKHSARLLPVFIFTSILKKKLKNNVMNTKVLEEHNYKHGKKSKSKTGPVPAWGGFQSRRIYVCTQF